jgi:O-antigen/teichoic acid export membrane protein
MQFRDGGMLDQLWGMRYYVIGLALQKGLPAAILPLLVAVFGRDVFATYVLFYATVQIYGTLTGLGLPLAIVPLWHASKSRTRFVAQCCKLVVVAAGAVGATLLLASMFWPGPIIGNLGAPETIGWLTVFALLYNLNLISLGVARSEGRDLTFLLSSVLGAVILLGGLALAWVNGWTGTRTLFCLQIASVAGTALALFGRHVRAYAVGWGETPNLLEGAVAQTRPLVANALLLLLAMSLDKWTAKAFFATDVFQAYVIDYQSAFTVMFVPTAVAINIGPKLSAAYSAGDFDRMDHDVRIARLLTFSGSLTIAVLMYSYSAIAGLHLTTGYWVLASAFLIEGQYAISSNRVMAERRFVRLFTSTAIGVAIFSSILIAAGLMASSELLYLGVPAYEIAMLVLIGRSLKGRASSA